MSENTVNLKNEVTPKKLEKTFRSHFMKFGNLFIYFEYLFFRLFKTIQVTKPITNSIKAA